MAVRSPVLVQPGTSGATELPSVPGPASASPLTTRFLPAPAGAIVEVAVGWAAAAGGTGAGVPQAARISERSAATASVRVVRACPCCRDMPADWAQPLKRR